MKYNTHYGFVQAYDDESYDNYILSMNDLFSKGLMNFGGIELGKVPTLLALR